MTVDDTLIALNKEQMKQLEKDLTKTIVAGLKMVNHSVGADKIQGQSEEYRRFHGQEYEQEFRTQYPKLYSRLSNIKNVQQWNQYSQYN